MEYYVFIRLFFAIINNNNLKMGQPCCSQDDSHQLEVHELSNSQLKSLRLNTEQTPETGSAVNNVQLYTDHMETNKSLEDQEEEVILPNDMTIYNYERLDFYEQIEDGHYDCELSSKDFPELTYEITQGVITHSTELSKLKHSFAENQAGKRVYDLSIESRELLVQASEGFKGSGYCQMMSKGREYFEGVIKDYQLYQGLLVLASGDYYFGSFKNYLPDGYTVLQCINRDKFEGFMINGRREGKGRIEWHDHAVYTGNFLDDRKSGQGKYTYPNGECYTGNFISDTKDGFGKSDSNSRCVHME